MRISIKLFLLLFPIIICSAFNLTAYSGKYGLKESKRIETSSSRKEVRRQKKVSKLRKRISKWQAKRADVSGFKKILFLFLIPFLLIGGLIKLLVSELTIGELLLATLGGYAIVVLFAITILLVALGEGPRG